MRNFISVMCLLVLATLAAKSMRPKEFAKIEKPVESAFQKVAGKKDVTHYGVRERGDVVLVRFASGVSLAKAYEGQTIVLDAVQSEDEGDTRFVGNVKQAPLPSGSYFKGRIEKKTADSKILFVVIDRLVTDKEVIPVQMSLCVAETQPSKELVGADWSSNLLILGWAVAARANGLLQAIAAFFGLTVGGEVDQYLAHREIPISFLKANVDDGFVAGLRVHRTFQFALD
jgi:hypothetical protein